MAMDSKNYIISVQASLKGDKVVISGLQQIEGATKKFKKTVDVAGKGTQSFDNIIQKAGMRALVVAPVWLALRSAMMLVLQTITAMIQSNIKFEDSMADIQTMLQGTGQEIEAQMITAKRAILDTSANSRRSLSDLSDAFRFLKSANLDFQETMAGFPVVARLMNAFGLSAEEASRAVAGMANTARKSFNDTMPLAEKFAKIGDILAYTYVKQDVLVGELISSYTKFAPYITSIDDDFGDVITTLGFLNTNMLRASRAGTITARALVTMASASDKLAQMFGITFDANKPISFLTVIEKLHNKLGEGTAITAEQTKALQETFGIRASVAVNLLVANFDKLKEAIKDARDNTTGFLERIEAIKMDTVQAQTQRLSNLLAVLTNEWVTGATSGEGMIVFLKQINEVLEASRLPVKRLGREWGYFIDTLQAISPSGIIAQLGGMLAGGAVVPLKGIKSWRQYLKETEEVAKKTEAQAKKDKEILEQADKLSKDTGDFKINAQKTYTEELKHGYDIMKANGANDLDIQKAKVEEFNKAENALNKIDELTKQITVNEELQGSAVGEAYYTLQGNTKLLKEELQAVYAIRTVRENFGSDSDYELAKTKEQNDLLVEQVKYRKQISDNMRSVGLDLLKTMGTQESQIITMKMKELDLDRKKIGDETYFAQMEVLRLSRIQAIVSEKLKERQIQAGLILDYQKADEMERARIRRVIELRKLSAEELGKQYETSPYDAGIIEANLGKLRPEQQEEITKKYADKYGFEYEDVKDIITDTAKETNPQIDANTKALIDLKDIMIALNQNIGIGTNGGGRGYFNNDAIVKTQQQFAIPNLNFSTAISQINISLPDDALSRVAEEAGDAVTQALLNNEELQRQLASKLRKVI